MKYSCLLCSGSHLQSYYFIFNLHSGLKKKLQWFFERPKYGTKRNLSVAWWWWLMSYGVDRVSRTYLLGAGFREYLCVRSFQRAWYGSTCTLNRKHDYDWYVSLHVQHFSLRKNVRRRFSVIAAFIHHHGVARSEI